MNEPDDIPQAEGVDASDTELELPDLPGDWEWRSANRYGSGKVNLYFGVDVHEEGGHFGEIDNYSRDGEVFWDLHIREIAPAPGNPHGNRPAGEADLVEQYDSLDAAIEAAPEYVNSHYETGEE